MSDAELVRLAEEHGVSTNYVDWRGTRTAVPVDTLRHVLTALGVAALFAVHGMAFAALRLTGPPHERVRSSTGRAGGPGTFALTSAAMAVLPLAAGARLPLTDTAAHGPVLGLLVPALLAVTPLLVAAQAWLWWTFRGRVTGPSYL